MKAEDFGYNPKTMIHSKVLSRAESIYLGILWIDHVGANNKISAIDFAVRFAWSLESIFIDPGDPDDKRTVEIWKREIRLIQNHLLDKHDDIPVLSKAGHKGGYWIAETEEEAEEFYNTFRKRGMTGLRKGTRGKKAAVVEAVEQLAFELDDIEDETEFITDIPAEKRPPMAPEIVDALLAKMTQEPEKFAPNLRKIREKFFSGAVLLDRKSILEMQNKVQDVLTGLTGLTG